jgi:hypothetical protein
MFRPALHVPRRCAALSPPPLTSSYITEMSLWRAVVVAIVLFCVIAKKLRLGPFKKKRKVKVVTKTKVVRGILPPETAGVVVTEGTVNPVGPDVESASAPKQHFCPGCGAKFPKETRFCASCGASNEQAGDDDDMGKD